MYGKTAQIGVFSVREKNNLMAGGFRGGDGESSSGGEDDLYSSQSSVVEVWNDASACDEAVTRQAH